MGVAFDAPLALLLLVPALGLTIALHLASRRRVGLGRRRLALVVRGLVLAFLVFALAGFRLVLPVDRLATVFVVDLSDSVGTAGREDALAWLRESLAVMPEGDVAGIVGFGRAALVERLPQEVREIDRIAPRPSARRPTSAPLCASPRRSSRTTPRSGSSSCPTATTRPARARARPHWLPLAGSRSRPGRSASGAADEVVLERLTTPSTAKIGEEIEASVDVSSTVAQPATIRLFADGGQVAVKSVSLEAGSNRVTFLVKPTTRPRPARRRRRGGSWPSRRRSR